MSSTAQLRPPGPAARRESKLGSWVGFIILSSLTTVAALIEMSMAGAMSWFTGVVFTLTSAFVAFTIRPRDLATAVISPPLAFLVAVIISAQPAVIGASGNLMLLEATTMLTSLAFNAQWVFVGTGVALVIVLVRRSSLRRQHAPEHDGG
ncbi:MAG: hypothetical protein QG597_4994 [Actinomycetota bacterium]|nr:hypothetical protein [Actinomycetota bacterium]